MQISEGEKFMSKTYILTRLDELKLGEHAGAIAKTLSNGAISRETSSPLTTSVWFPPDSGPRSAHECLALQFSNATLFIRFGRLCLDEQQALASALYRTASEAKVSVSRMGQQSCTELQLEVEIDWSPKKKRRIRIDLEYGEMSKGRRHPYQTTTIVLHLI